MTELVLRGIFLLRDEELKWMYQGRGANFVFPEAWEAYEAAIPANERRKRVLPNLFFAFAVSQMMLKPLTIDSIIVISLY